MVPVPAVPAVTGTCSEEVHVNSNLAGVGVSLENGRRYAALVQVRKDGLKAYLDGKLVGEYKTNYKDLSMDPSWRLTDPRVLGLGTCNASAFYAVRVLEVGGRGKVGRAGQPSAQPAPPNPPGPAKPGPR